MGNANPMHNLEPNLIDRTNLAPAKSGGGWATRTRTDVTSLLLELARALRGYCFYGETDAQRRPLLDRAFRALSGELSRAGAIDLELREAGFSLTGMPPSQYTVMRRRSFSHITCRVSQAVIRLSPGPSAVASNCGGGSSTAVPSNCCQRSKKLSMSS